MAKMLIVLTLFLAGCASFEDTAWQAKKQMNYQAHSDKVTEWEPISANKGWIGDCSNFAAYMVQQYPAAKVYWGQAQDGQMHVIACEDETQQVCTDTMHNYIFSNYEELWKIQPIEIDIGL